MGKSVQIKVSNLADAKTQLDKEADALDDLLSRIKKLSFSTDAKSTGASARQMKDLTQVQMQNMAATLKELVVKTSALLDDAKEKYEFMDNSIAGELKSK